MALDGIGVVVLLLSPWVKGLVGTTRCCCHLLVRILIIGILMADTGLVVVVDHFVVTVTRSRPT